MLTRFPKAESVSRRKSHRDRKSWHNAELNMHSLGCAMCPERALCGGLQVSAPLFWCLDYCCGNPGDCGDKFVCPNNPHFVDRVREVRGFDLSTVERAPCLAVPRLPHVIPMLFHGNSREKPLASPAAALPLSAMFNRRDGGLRHTTRDALCATYAIDPGTQIVLSGTDSDPSLERWWAFGREVRRKLIRGFRDLGTVLVTTPNYSLFIKQPRWDDMHSMKRIGIVHSEFLNEGLPAALHVNARTDMDFQRWTEYIVARPEVRVVAYEFTTGTGWAGRREIHARWLAELGRAAGRSLHLVVRGGIELLPELMAAFERVSVIETSAFMKTIKRQRAVPVGNRRLAWLPSPTAPGEPLDSLFAQNLAAVLTSLENLMAPTLIPVRARTANA
jgi:hypothetical protein